MSAAAIARLGRSVASVSMVLALAACETVSTTTSPAPSASATAAPLVTPIPTASPVAEPTMPPPSSLDPIDPGPSLAQAVAPMAQARFGHAAVLLRDGRVMVVGGRYVEFGTNGVHDATLSSVELFDPATGTWAPGPSLHRWRENPVALVLGDGRVLVLGGFEGVGGERMDEDDPTAEVFDPKTSSWTVIKHVPFRGTGGVVLRSGAVLAVGIVGQGAEDTTSSSSFEPATGTFGPVKVIPGVALYPTATVLLDGRVLVAGGLTGGDSDAIPRQDAAVYDPTTGTWAAIKSMPEPMYDHAMLTLADGRAMALGGGTTELFDPATGRWTVAGPPASNREKSRLVGAPDGRVLAIGSFSGTIDSRPIIESFDVRTGTWSTATLFPIVEDTSATLLADGRVLIAGGLLECRFGQACEDQRVVANAWLLDPADLT